MSLGSPFALLLVSALGVLLWLALRPRRPRPMAVGTLMLWRRVASATHSASRSSRQFDALLWLLAAALAVGAFAAARPLWVSAAGEPLVDVYVECLEASGPEPDLEALIRSLRAAAPGATIRCWSAGVLHGVSNAEVRRLNPGPLEAEIAQFEAAAGPSRIYALCAPEARPGLVVARAHSPREGILFEAGATDGVLSLQLTAGAIPIVKGATVTDTVARGREVTVRAEVEAAEIQVALPGREISLTRSALAVGVGADWTGARHAALLGALRPDARGQGPPDVWLGAEQGVPGIRINQGQASAVGELQIDAQHSLFRELPLAQVRLGDRSMPPQSDRHTLARAGESEVLVSLSADGRVLFFAGDPFTDSDVAAATLLLDNAIGVVTGVRASERQSYELNSLLPSRRQALAESFTPVGVLEPPAALGSSTELGPWLMLAAAACSLVAAITVLRRAGGALPG